jgi:hypothetical protein
MKLTRKEFWLGLFGLGTATAATVDSDQAHLQKHLEWLDRHKAEVILPDPVAVHAELKRRMLEEEFVISPELTHPSYGAYCSHPHYGLALEPQAEFIVWDKCTNVSRWMCAPCKDEFVRAPHRLMCAPMPESVYWTLPDGSRTWDENLREVTPGVVRYDVR